LESASPFDPPETVYAALYRKASDVGKDMTNVVWTSGRPGHTLSTLKEMVARLENWLSERKAERRVVAEYRTAWRRLLRLRRYQKENGRSVSTSSSSLRSSEWHD